MFRKQKTFVSVGVQSLLRNNESRLFRFALGTVFVWFGLLKLLGQSSVFDIIHAAYPFLATAPFLQALGFGEVVLGLGILSGWKVRLFASLMVAHLAGTLLVPFLAPSVVFEPSFPLLSIQGEFVVKNLVLMSPALFLMSED